MKYIGSKCGFAFKREIGLKIHNTSFCRGGHESITVQQISGCTNNTTCHQCGRKFHSSHERKRHEEIHDRMKFRFSVPSCGHAFQMAAGLKQHNANAHNMPQEISSPTKACTPRKRSGKTCNLCYRVIRSQYEMDLHKKFHDSLPYQCPFPPCKQLFWDFSRLISHTKSSHNQLLTRKDKPRCRVQKEDEPGTESDPAEAAAGTGQNLPRRTADSNNGRSKFPTCTFCFRTFMTVERDEHEAHHENMVHECTHCSFRFIAFGELEKHVFDKHNMLPRDNRINEDARLSQALPRQRNTTSTTAAVVEQEATLVASWDQIGMERPVRPDNFPFQVCSFRNIAKSAT